jgi:acetyl esterase/lipase
MQHFKKHNILLIILLILSVQTFFAQNSCSNRYKERSFNSIQIFRDVKYSKSAPKLIASSLGVETTIDKDLVMDIFMPPPTDTVQKRPLVIIAHGGGFIDVAFMGGTLLVGTKDNDDVQALCDTLAHWGYVTACIEYRTGFDIASTTSIKRAVWRGAQDMSAALRFFRKNAQWFNIDPERVFIGGSSAGAFCAIHSTFIDYTERIPESLQQAPLVQLDLGALHSRPVVELTAFNPFAGNNVIGNDVDSLPKGLVAFWGAIADTSMFSGINKAPMIMFHGTADPVVSSQCAQPFASVVLTAPVTCGSEIMDIAMTQRNLPHDIYLAPGEGHEYWGALNGMWTLNGPNAFWDSIISTTADYFYELMRPLAPTLIGPAACAPNTVYTFSVNNPNIGSDYCWEVDGGNILSLVPNASSIDVIFTTNNAIAYVKCTERDRADVISQQRIKGINISTLVSSVNYDLKEFDFKIFPNPAGDYFELVVAADEFKHGILDIIDLNGKILRRISVNDKNLKIDCSSISSGYYLLRLISDQKTISKPFIIK